MFDGSSKTDYSLIVYEGIVVLAPANPFDPLRRENSRLEVVVVNDNGGVKNINLVVVHSVKSADGADMEDHELTLLAKGLEKRNSGDPSMDFNQEFQVGENVGIGHLYYVLYELNDEFVVTTLTPTAITNCISSIEPLNGTYFSSWREQVKISLGITDLDYALRFNKPNPLTTTSTVDEKRTYEIWERSNHMSLMIMKNSISVVIRCAIPNSKNAKEFLKYVEEHFKGSSKANVSTLILKMLTIKYDGLSRVHEHIMMMNDMDSKLNDMDMAIFGGFLIHFIMTYLPAQFATFKINYNT
ncbi:hypothetical protein Tco_0617217 [Tanacetum coccineum]